MRILIALLLCALPAFGTACDSTSLQAAVNAASSGDTITVAGGSATYTTAVTISGKWLTINGGNCAITTSLHNAIDITAVAGGTTRITNFTFPSSGSNVDSTAVIRAHTSSSTAAFRIDHNTFSTDFSTSISVDGNGAGVIDHNTFSATGLSEVIHNLGMGSGVTTGWTNDVTPGSSAMLFVEDNTSTFTASGNPAYCFGSFVQSYNGARTVVRHNTIANQNIDQHGTPGAVGARWWEIYNNTFDMTTPNASCAQYIHIRGGSGVVFNNSVIGSNLVTGGLVFEEEDANAWEQAFQVGNGRGGTTDGGAGCSSGTIGASPAYSWNNTGMTLAYDGVTIQINRDFFDSGTQPGSLRRQQLSTDTCSTTYAYTPYTYPNPLVASPAVTLSASSHNYGAQNTLTTSSPFTFTVTNSGTATLTFSATPALGGTNFGDFAITSNTCGTTGSTLTAGARP